MSRITIYLDGKAGNFTARAYDDDTDQHIGSSERAATPTLALTEVARAVDGYVRGPVGV